MSILSEQSVSLAALLTAVVAVALSIYEGRSQRAHQRLSVQPEITFQEKSPPQRDFVGLTISNYGLGPALIKKFTISVDGVEVENWDEALDKLKINSDADWVVTWNSLGETPIKPDAIRHVFGLFKEGEHYTEEKVDLIVEAAKRINIFVEHCSLYNECWHTRFR